VSKLLLANSVKAIVVPIYNVQGSRPAVLGQGGTAVLNLVLTFLSTVLNLVLNLLLNLVLNLVVKCRVRFSPLDCESFPGWGKLRA
jgi:hypothetical protein